MTGIELARTGGLCIRSAGCQEETVCMDCNMAALRRELEQRFKCRATVVLWMMHRILWGIWDGSQITFVSSGGKTPEADELYWQELRIFNEEMELHLLRSDDKLKGRFIRDAGEQAREHVDSISRFWGEREASEDCLCLVDRSRKLRLELPQVAGDGQYYGLVTRAYIGIHPRTHQAGYVDYRFLRIACADVKGE